VNLSLNLLIVQLGVLFLPGLIWARLHATYAAKVKPSEIEFFLHAFMFGLTVYGAEFIIFVLLGRHFVMADLADAGTKPVVTLQIVYELLWAIVIGFVLAIVWLYFSTYKLLTIALQKIGATKKFGDEDIWDFTLNSRDAAVEYVHFRDFENGYVYAGWVSAFSETDKIREVVLLDVIAYNLEGQELYTMPRMYIARSPENMTIEFPFEKKGDQDGENS
jgi:hypothetical protein